MAGNGFLPGVHEHRDASPEELRQKGALAVFARDTHASNSANFVLDSLALLPLKVEVGTERNHVRLLLLNLAGMNSVGNYATVRS